MRIHQFPWKVRRSQEKLLNEAKRNMEVDFPRSNKKWIVQSTFKIDLFWGQKGYQGAFQSVNWGLAACTSNSGCSFWISLPMLLAVKRVILSPESIPRSRFFKSNYSYHFCCLSRSLEKFCFQKCVMTAVGSTLISDYPSTLAAVPIKFICFDWMTRPRSERAWGAGSHLLFDALTAGKFWWLIICTNWIYYLNLAKICLRMENFVD